MKRANGTMVRIRSFVVVASAIPEGSGVFFL